MIERAPSGDACQRRRMPPVELIVVGVLLLATAGGCTGGGHAGHRGGEPAGEGHPISAADADIVVPPRTPQLATFPCVAQCHRNLQEDASPRQLTGFHSLKHIEHGDTTFWCNFCHDLSNLDQLRLLDNRTVTFDEAYRLCGQCHGDKRRDWALGIHGLQTGQWNGQKTRRSCTACHDPHSPRRPTFQALPAPHPRTGEQ